MRLVRFLTVRLENQGVGTVLAKSIMATYGAQEKVTLYGYAHESQRYLRQFYKTLEVRENTAMETFPANFADRLKQVFPDDVALHRGWISFWFPERLYLQKTKLFFFAAGREVKGREIGIKANYKLLKSFLKDDDVEFRRHEMSTISRKQLKPMLEAYRNYGIEKIIFWYSGHGANMKGSEYPSFELATGKLFSLEAVHQMCIELGFTMSIVAADTCNKSFDVDEFVPASTGLLAQKERLKEANLTWSAEGHLLFASSSKDEYSFGKKYYGGLFTNHFFQNFIGNTRWKAALRETKKELEDKEIAYDDIEEGKCVKLKQRGITPLWKGDFKQEKINSGAVLLTLGHH